MALPLLSSFSHLPVGRKDVRRIGGVRARDLRGAVLALLLGAAVVVLLVALAVITRNPKYSPRRPLLVPDNPPRSHSEPAGGLLALALQSSFTQATSHAVSH